MNHLQNIPILGIALILAFIAGKAARNFKIPQVTAYIFVGIFLGPSILNIMTIEIADSFYSINQLAFGLILFNIGGEFHRGLFKAIAWKQVKYSFIFANIIWILVFISCFLFSQFTDLSLLQKIAVSIFLGIVAVAAAPPTTLLVIKECNAKGPLTQSIIVFLAVGTVLSITGAHAATFLFQDLGIWSGKVGGYFQQIILLIWSVLGSLIVGTILGLILSFWEQKEKAESELLLAVICAILLGQTLAFYLKLEPLLISLSLGFSLVNSSPFGQAIHAKIKGLGLSIYALFFVIAGAHIHIQEQITTIGLLGAGYIVGRTGSIIISAFLASKISRENPVIGKYMGLSVLSHAGAALAIVIKLNDQSDKSAYVIISVVMSSIFIFEILGPILLRYTLIKVGEVNVEGILGRSFSSHLSIKELINNFLQNLGIIKPIEKFETKTIKLLINRKIQAIHKKLSFKEVINFIDKHHQDIYPVVDDEYHFLGTISISEIKDVMFDPFISKILFANKLIGSKACVYNDSTFEEAISIFNENGAEVLPVIDSKKHKLVGVLTYKDIILALKK